MQSDRAIVPILVPTRISCSSIEVESYGCTIHKDDSLIWDVVDIGLVPWHYSSGKMGVYLITPNSRTFASFIGRIL